MMLLALVVGLTVSACAFGTSMPGYVACKGKGNFTVTGALGGGMLYGGGGLNTATVTADCGDGLTFEQGKAAPAAAPVVK